MFGSQALETAIGLALLFFVLASGASAIVEALSRVLEKRAKDLEATLADMLSGTVGTVGTVGTAKPADSPADSRAFALLEGTSVYASARAAVQQARRFGSNRARPAYLSAKSFADAIVELIDSDQLTGDVAADGLRRRVKALVAEAENDLLHVKAGLESWFDDTMARLGEEYKRWASVVLFVVGLAIAAVGNISAIDVAQGLWQQPTVRQAALNAAEQAAAKGVPTEGFVDANVKSVQDLADLALPVGWPGTAEWTSFWPVVAHLAGWLITAVLVMLGAPFWFDLLSRLLSLRSATTKPRPATLDSASATSLRATTSRPTAGLLGKIQAMPGPSPGTTAPAVEGDSGTTEP